MIRKRGWPVTIKTFRTKCDAEDWARRTEDEVVRGVYIDRAGAERLLLATAENPAFVRRLLDFCGRVSAGGAFLTVPFMSFCGVFDT